MKKKVIATVLILANLMTLASCSQASNSDTPKSRKTAEAFSDDEEEADDDDKTNDDSKGKIAEDRVYNSIDKIATALAECDYDGFCELCTYTPYEIRSVMPVIVEADEIDYSDTYIRKSPSEMLRVKNLIAATTTYEIDKSSFKSNLWAKECTVNVTFSYKDFSSILNQRDKFLGAADFNMLLAEVEDTVDLELTLEFTKEDDGHYLLANGRDLVDIYDYDLPELEFMDNIFDTVKDSYMTGPGWDPVTETYTDTNTFEFVIELDENASDYVWQYKYRVAEETSPEWTPLFTSEKIIDKYPTEIRLTYTQEENIPSGFYVFFIYDMQSGTIYGWEFNVVNTAETVPVNTVITGTVTETDETAETEEPDDET